MVDIVITPASVVSAGAASTSVGTAGETILAGQVVYLDTVTGKWKLADSNSATAAVRQAGGIAAHGASLNQPITVYTRGPVTIGGTLTPGVAYYLSDTPGGICTVADIGTGEYSCFLGMATSATVLDISIKYSGVAL